MTRPTGEDGILFGQPGPPVPRADLQTLLEEAGLPASITELSWSARYRLQHRLAGRFRKGRLYLAGDAAHAHSPATGQGMNTGIQDAINLGWKLPFAAAAADVEPLLDSYELERRPVARRLLRLTHLAFLAEASSNSFLSLMRSTVAPLGAPMVPVLSGHRALVAEVIRIVSQWRTGYPASPLSVEGVPRMIEGPRVGYRLPDSNVVSEGQPVRLHALIAKPGAHVLLSADAAVIEQLDFGPRVWVHRLTTTPGTGIVALRPDGYVGFRSQVADEAQLRGWLARVGANVL